MIANIYLSKGREATHQGGATSSQEILAFSLPAGINVDGAHDGIIEFSRADLEQTCKTTDMFDPLEPNSSTILSPAERREVCDWVSTKAVSVAEQGEISPSGCLDTKECKTCLLACIPTLVFYPVCMGCCYSYKHCDC